MFNKARDVDVAVFNAITSELDKEFVLDSLMMYQNTDGGFGGGLFIDNYNPASSIYVTYEALRILYICGFDSLCNDELYTKLINKALNYIYNRNDLIKKTNSKRNIKSNDNFAHSDFFSFNAIDNNYYPSASIFALTLFLINPSKAYYKKAMNYLKIAINELLIQDSYNEYELISIGLIVEICSKLNLFEEEINKLNERANKAVLEICSKKMMNGQILKMPVVLALGLKFNDDVAKKYLPKNLDFIIDNRSSHGLWEPFHKWNTSYPEEESAKLKWIGYISANYVYILKKVQKNCNIDFFGI
ncbi:MAG: hypothetical protein L6U99_14315 [Clostridium sp.]|nr:MAG: hypothetical protein L6U99_14315 [Clostridium sp.]